MTTQTRLLQTRDLSKAYHHGSTTLQALKSIDLDLPRGAFTALVGPSGSGKSTLLNICGLIDQCDTGQLLFDGEDYSNSTVEKMTKVRRHKLGFVFQGFNLVPVMSVYDNVEYPLLLADVPAAERKQQVSELLDRVGLLELAAHLPDQISGGQKQRAAIARALVKKPLLVIADEPTANLDTATASDVIDLMRDMSEDFGCSFMIATHDERMSSRCDEILQLEDGELQGELQGEWQ
jgi:putative ABC transport system ATP-binding protein